MQNKRSLGKNTVYNLIKNISAIAFPLITFPYISRVLGVVNVGKINFGNSIVSYISLIATLGISTYAIRECSKVKDDRKKLSDISSQLFSFNMMTTIIAYAFFFLLLLLEGKLIAYRNLLMIQSMSIIFSTLGADWLNSAMEDFRYITYRTVLFQLVSLILLFIFVRKPEDYLTYAIITIISSSGSSITNILYRRKFCDIHFVLKIDWRTHLKPVLLFFAIAISQQINLNLDVTMLGFYKGDYEVGLYTTATKIYSIINMLIISLNQVTLPKMSQAYFENDYEEINRLYRYAASVIITIGMPCVVGILILAPNIISIIAGSEFLGASLVLRLLMIPLVFSSLVGLIGGLLFVPSGRENTSLLICVISALINAITNIILIPKYGLYAAAVTTGIAEISSFVLCIPSIEKEIHLSNKYNLLLGPFLGVVTFSVVDVFLLNRINVTAIMTIFIIALSVFLYTVVLYITKNELLMCVLKKNSLDKK